MSYRDPNPEHNQDNSNKTNNNNSITATSTKEQGQTLTSLDDLLSFDDEDDDPAGNDSDSGKSTKSHSSQSSKFSINSNISGKKRVAVEFDTDCSSFSESEEDDVDDEEESRPWKRCTFRPQPPNKAPIEPFCLASTKFTCDKNLIDIECELKFYFDQIRKSDLEERFHSFLVSRNSLNDCSYRVNIYTPSAYIEYDGGVEQHIVEVVHEDGDKYLFYQIFAEIKRMLLSKKIFKQDLVYEVLKDVNITASQDFPPVH